jgi:hypoxanthine phosphoribosyltransferase
MDKVRVCDKDFHLYIDNNRIQQKVAEIAIEIAKEYRDKNPLLLCVLNGAFIFAADLFRQINYPAEISFIKLNSYNGTKSTGTVKTLIGLNQDINGRHLVVVEDIIDTGKTMFELFPVLAQQQPASIKLASILCKPEVRIHDVYVDYTGFEIPDKFVVGYGLDYNGHGRNLPHIYTLVEQEIKQ